MEWISVKDRMPPDMQCVLVTIESENGKRYVQSDIRFNSSRNTWEWAYEAGADYWQDMDYEVVTHWMPLPEPAED